MFFLPVNQLTLVTIPHVCNAQHAQLRIHVEEGDKRMYCRRKRKSVRKMERGREKVTELKIKGAKDDIEGRTPNVQ